MKKTKPCPAIANAIRRKIPTVPIQPEDGTVASKIGQGTSKDRDQRSDTVGGVSMAVPRGQSTADVGRKQKSNIAIANAVSTSKHATQRHVPTVLGDLPVTGEVSIVQRSDSTVGQSNANVLRRQKKVYSAIANAIPPRLPSPETSNRTKLERRKQAISSAVEVKERDIEASLGALSLCAEAGEMDADRKYRIALRNSGLYFQVDQGQAAAVAEWDSARCEVLPNSYRFITPLLFHGSDGSSITILQCTCNAAVQQLQSLSRNLLSNAAVANIQNRYCQHCKVVGYLCIHLRTLDDDEISGDVEIEQQCNDPLLMWTVKTMQGTYGMVQRSKRGILSCISCNTKRGCNHVTTFERERAGFEIELPPVLPVEEKHSVLSVSPIVYSDGMLAAFSYPVKEGFAQSSSMTEVTCEHGLQSSVGTRTVENACVIYDILGQPYKAGMVDCNVVSGCGCRINFDGGRHGVINVNNKSMVEYRLLEHYMSHFGRDGLPLVAFHDSLVDLNRKLRMDCIPYEILYRAWNGFEIFRHDFVLLLSHLWKRTSSGSFGWYGVGMQTRFFSEAYRSATERSPDAARHPS